VSTLATAIPSAATATNVWRFQPHPEVWLLVAFLIGAYTYAVRVIGPRAVPDGSPAVSRRQIGCFIAAMALLWSASDWPVHDIGEEHLYSVHMLQHMMLSYFMPPLALLATPAWLARLVIGDGKLYSAVRWLTKPVVAAVVFNTAVMVTHVPGVVNASVVHGPLHYTLHAGVVLTSLLMWMPVVGPLPEIRIGPAGQMIYLFAQSVIPTVPAGWLTFANGVVYKVYDHPPRMFGLSVTDDQQLAGVIMKVGGSVFLWTIITVLFFTRFMHNWEAQNSFKSRRVPDVEVVGHDDVELTYDDVARAFGESRAPSEPEHPVGGE
jgi:putative membrane protein